jgi:hypothetical protein
MFGKYILAVAIATAFVVPIPAIGADDADVQQIRKEIQDLKDGYEARIRELEQRLEQLEHSPASVPAPSDAAAPVPTVEAAPAPTVEAAPAPAQSAPASANSFNPAISLILNGQLNNLERDPANYQIGGFIPGQGDGGVGPGVRGFTVGESELTFAANVDPYFSGALTLSIDTNNDVLVEESFVQNTGAIPGTTIKFGRFLSGFGYLNGIHAHAWDFVDSPLVYQAFFGGQLLEDGIQARWLAPTPMLLEFGVETGNGQAFPGSDLNKNGANAGTFFVHLGDDVGFSNSYLIGASYRTTRAEDRTYGDVNAAGTPVTNAFTGDSRMWGAQIVWKWAPNGNPVDRNFKFQSEYMHRVEDGSLAYDITGANLSNGYRSSQSGWYAQGAYQFIPRWRVGLRYDELRSGNTDIGLVTSGALTAADFPLLAENNPKRSTAMIDFSPSEFSRFRLQFSRDEARFNEPDNEVFLQYIMSLGTHGAHKF